MLQDYNFCDFFFRFFSIAWFASSSVRKPIPGIHSQGCNCLSWLLPFKTQLSASNAWTAKCRKVKPGCCGGSVKWCVHDLKAECFHGLVWITKHVEYWLMSSLPAAWRFTTDLPENPAESVQDPTGGSLHGRAACGRGAGMWKEKNIGLCLLFGMLGCQKYL